MQFSASSDNLAFPVFLVISLMAMWVLLHLVLSLGVATDAQRLKKAGRETQLLGPGSWWFFTILTGPVGFAFYWVMHHSSLRDVQADPRIDVPSLLNSSQTQPPAS